MADENENTALALSRDEVAALIPAGPESLMETRHADSSEPERKFVSIPYIGFRGKKTEKGVEALDAAGIAVDDFYLKDIEPIKVKPFELHVLKYARFFTQQDEDMNVTGVLTTSDDDAFQDGYRELLIGVAAVVLSPGNYVPATFSFRGGHTKTLKDTLVLLDKAKDDKGWAARSAKHAATVAIPVPGLRLRTRIWSTREKPIGGGKDYNEGHGQVFPTPEAEVEKLKTWTGDAWTRLQLAVTKFNINTEKLRRGAANAAAKVNGDPIPF